jgi:hypothetical protein
MMLVSLLASTLPLFIMVGVIVYLESRSNKKFDEMHAESHQSIMPAVVLVNALHRQKYGCDSVELKEVFSDKDVVK